MAGEVTSGGLPKPVLKGLHHATIKTNLIVALSLCAVSVVVVKFLRNDPVKQSYADFYKNYDPQKSFERMNNAGLMQASSK